jgi:hypothetical protein
MFIDGEKLDYKDYHSDMDYSNHINWFTGSGHNEAHRYKDAQDWLRGKCPIPSNSAPCTELKSAKDCLAGRLASAKGMGAGSSGARRVRDRAIKAANSYLTPVTQWYTAAQCDSVLTTVTPGCTDMGATNFNPNADQDDGTCVFPASVVYGCRDTSAFNYDPNATTDDNSCQYPQTDTRVYGCKKTTANNYDPTATHEDGSCRFDAPSNIFDTPTYDDSGELMSMGPDGLPVGTEDNTMMYIIGGLVVLGAGYMLMK